MNETQISGSHVPYLNRNGITSMWGFVSVSQLADCGIYEKIQNVILIFILCRIVPNVVFYFLSCAIAHIGPMPTHFWGSKITQTHTPGRTPLDEWSARRRGRDLQSRQRPEETNIHAFVGVRTRDPSNREAADQRRRLHGHRDRQRNISKL